FHFFQHTVRGSQLVGTRLRDDGNADGGQVAGEGAHAVVLARDLDARDVTQACEGTVAIDLEHDVGEFLRRFQSPFYLNGQLEGGLAVRNRLLADGAGSHLHVLAAQRGDDFTGRQVA